MRGKRWALLGVVLLSGLALATAQAYGQEEVDQLEELFAPKPPYAEPEVPEPTLQPGLLPPPPPLPEAAPEPFIAAYNLYREGRLQEAYGAFNAYLQEFPAVPTTDDAVYYLGEISYRQGQYAEALRLYQYLLDKLWGFASTSWASTKGRWRSWSPFSLSSPSPTRSGPPGRPLPPLPPGGESGLRPRPYG
jgi:TolA-binding protein